ncbi:MAG: hypothetical protein MUF71_13935 [Candidatus Kapabacteria bacterium]|jgi:hypothetical protein|nr:hypothetical protein [Candidatus Kapabacteria bacterium]
MTNHWNYFLALEADFGVLSRYVEISQQNYPTYSIEIAKLLMAATQECDVLLKQLSGLTSGNEQDYRTALLLSMPNITKIGIKHIASGIEVRPYSSWSSSPATTPTWWTANNKVKHERHNKFGQANIENLLGAFFGLYVANLIFHKDDLDKLVIPKYFEPIIDNNVISIKSNVFPPSYRSYTFKLS